MDQPMDRTLFYLKDLELSEQVGHPQVPSDRTATPTPARSVPALKNTPRVDAAIDLLAKVRRRILLEQQRQNEAGADAGHAREPLNAEAPSR